MEQYSRTIQWYDPTEGTRRGLQMAGLDYMRAILSGDIPPPPVSALIQMSFHDAGEGWITFTYLPDQSHYNPLGTVHGGPIATVLDSALGSAVHTTLPAGTGYPTLEIKVNYVRPITTQTGIMTCEGKVINRGRRVATSEAHLRDNDGKLFAHATSTCILFDL